MSQWIMVVISPILAQQQILTWESMVRECGSRVPRQAQAWGEFHRYREIQFITLLQEILN